MEFESFAHAMMEHIRPKGMMEQTLSDELIGAIWQLKQLRTAAP
jgi:hypothetical protein